MNSNLLPSFTARNFTITVKPEEYLKKGVEFNHYKAIAFLRVLEKEIEFADETVIALSKPELDVNVSGNQRIDQPVTTSVRFKNPFRDQPLTKCKLTVRETEISEKSEKKVKDIPANGVFNYNLTHKPKKDGDGILTVMLDCDELHDIRGHTSYNVEK